MYMKNKTTKKKSEHYEAPSFNATNITIEHNFLQASGTGQSSGDLDFSGELW
jgi:hypothetical protein